MRGAAALLLLLVLAACAADGGGTRGPYVGGALGGNLRDDARQR